uniref:Bm9623 n=1 Tax=Brugia malayi TaxID=6279 RepID=A0A1I9GCW6_BRUMA|nr:Bm9623 [Brugia malayi]
MAVYWFRIGIRYSELLLFICWFLSLLFLLLCAVTVVVIIAVAVVVVVVVAVVVVVVIIIIIIDTAANSWRRQGKEGELDRDGASDGHWSPEVHWNDGAKPDWSKGVR